MTSDTTWKHLLNQLIARQNLTHSEMTWAMKELMSGATSEAVAGAFLVALHVKGETPEELAALAQAMINHAEPIFVDRAAVDIVGTGGDQHNTVNISTMASLVVAGAGIPVIKHGNRASSSASGSADVLAELGLNLEMSIEDVAGAVETAGITFLFAQVFHPSMRHLAPVRRALGVPTAFNYLGPMTNPARVKSSAVGVADASMAEKMAEVFASRGDHALVFRGSDGLDELTISGDSTIWEALDGGVECYTLNPADFGFELGNLADLKGGDAKHNAQVVREVLGGSRGPIRTAVVLNAAAGITAYKSSKEASFTDRFKQAIGEAEKSIDSGAANAVLERWISYSQSRSLA